MQRKRDNQRNRPDPGYFEINDLFATPARFKPAIDLELKNKRFTWSPEHSGKVLEEPDSWYWFAKDFEVTLHLKRENQGLIIRLTLTNLSTFPLKLHTLDPAVWSLDPAEFKRSEYLSVFQNGFQSWSPARFRHARDRMTYPRVKSFGEMNHYTDSRFWRRRDGLSSYQFIVVKFVNVDVDKTLISQ